MKKRLLKITAITLSALIIFFFLRWYNMWVVPVFIDSISFYESPGFYQNDGTLIKEIEDSRSIRKIVNAINSGEMRGGILDVVEPHYQITLNYINKRKVDVLLWISEDYETGMFMLKENTHKGYTIDGERTQLLIDILLDDK
jgi:hypothetical protein